MKAPTDTLALFDFDGTLTVRDTFLDFLRFYHGNARFYTGMLSLSPWLVAFKLGLLPNWRAKELVLTWFWKSEKNRVFLDQCTNFQRERLPNLMRPEAVACLRAHQAAGHRVVVVSASAEDWIGQWCLENNVECLATQLERAGEGDGQYLTGKLNGKNCYGEEKVRRVEAHLDRHAFSKIYAYGDSRSGDGPMLAWATLPRFRSFPLP
jgi:HAD superfamily hydrolase (TIGR01490 family)